MSWHRSSTPSAGTIEIPLNTSNILVWVLVLLHLAGLYAVQLVQQRLLSVVLLILIVCGFYHELRMMAAIKRGRGVNAIRIDAPGEWYVMSSDTFARVHLIRVFPLSRFGFFLCFKKAGAGSVGVLVSADRVTSHSLRLLRLAVQRELPR